MSSSSSNTAISCGSVNDDNEHNNETTAVVSTPKKQLKSFLQRLILQLDEFIIVKLVMRVWGARLEFIVRLMLLATFFDDTVRTVRQFTRQSQQISDNFMWFLDDYNGNEPLLSIVATILLGLGLIAQWLGSLGILALIHPDASTKSLIIWMIVQPILYAQLSNAEFILNSLSLVGGLLILRSQIVFTTNNDTSSNKTKRDLSELLGRLLVPAAYLYDARFFISWTFIFEETENFTCYSYSFIFYILTVIFLLALVVGSTLVAAGIKSRTIPLLLAIINFVYICYEHPFFLRYIRDWDASLPNVALSAYVTPSEITNWQVYDLHQYYFFLGLSASAALLLLGQFGLHETKGI